MSEQMTPEEAKEYARSSYSDRKDDQEIIKANKRSDRLESASLEKALASDPMSVNKDFGFGRYKGGVMQLELKDRIRVAQDRHVVTEHLDAFREAALSDAALVGVHIELQQADDAGQNVEVHTPEHQ